jgi:hypothetical protein
MPYIEMLGMGLKHLGTTFVGWFNISKATLEGVAKVAMSIFEPMIKQFQGFGEVVASFKDIANPKKMFEGMKKGAETYVEGVKDALDFKDRFDTIKGAVKDVSGVFVEEFDKISDSGAKTLNDITDKYNNIGKEIDVTTNKASGLNDEMDETPPAGGGGGGGGTITTGGSKGGKVTQSKGRFDEADANQSGAVTDRERREFERKQREIEQANRRLKSAELGLEQEFGSLSNAQEQENASRFGSLENPVTRGGRVAKRFSEAQSEVARLDPNSPLSQMGQTSPLDQSKQGGGAGESEDGKSEEMKELLEQIKELNETTDENIGDIKDLMDKIDGALT